MQTCGTEPTTNGVPGTFQNSTGFRVLDDICYEMTVWFQPKRDLRRVIRVEEYLGDDQSPREGSPKRRAAGKFLAVGGDKITLKKLVPGVELRMHEIGRNCGIVEFNECLRQGVIGRLVRAPW